MKKKDCIDCLEERSPYRNEVYNLIEIFKKLPSNNYFDSIRCELIIDLFYDLQNVLKNPQLSIKKFKKKINKNTISQSFNFLLYFKI